MVDISQACTDFYVSNVRRRPVPPRGHSRLWFNDSTNYPSLGGYYDVPDSQVAEFLDYNEVSEKDARLESYFEIADLTESPYSYSKVEYVSTILAENLLRICDDTNCTASHWVSFDRGPGRRMECLDRIYGDAQVVIVRQKYTTTEGQELFRYGAFVKQDGYEGVIRPSVISYYPDFEGYISEYAIADAEQNIESVKWGNDE